MRKKMGLFQRMLIYATGIFLVSLGIVLCKKSQMGVSPVSMIPYVLEGILPLTFGHLTTVFHFINIALQMFLEGKLFQIRLWLQIPLAFAFGLTIDWISGLFSFSPETLVSQAAVLALSVFFTALGMVCMIRMDLVQNPPDGLVRDLSGKLGRELGTVKIGYDFCCVLLAVGIGLVFLGRPRGLGAATLVSAVFVGRTVTWLRDALRWQKTGQEEGT